MVDYKINLKSGMNENGIMEFYLVSLDMREDFDIVIYQLQHLGAEILDCIDGIYSRIAKLFFEGNRFIVIFHEDVGVYSFLEGDQSNASNNWLARILEIVVKEINNN